MALAPIRPSNRLNASDSKASLIVIQVPCAKRGPKPCKLKACRPEEVRKSFMGEVSQERVANSSPDLLSGKSGAAIYSL